MYFYHSINKTSNTNKARFCLQAPELDLTVIDQMVWKPENLARNALLRISIYKDTVLRPLEVSWLGLHNFNQEVK